MKKVLIITADKCDDSELFYPYFRLIEAGMTPVIASFERGEVHAKYHFTAEAELAVSEIDTKEYDALLLPGGMAPEKLRNDENVIATVEKFNREGKPIAAICHGQQILISSGILKGRNATCYPGIKDDLKNAGALYKNEKVVVDKNLVTSRRPEDLPYFMYEILKLINNM